MKKLLLCFMMMFLLAEISWAQLGASVFTSSTGTYTEITGGTLLGTGSASDDEQRYVNPAVPQGGNTSSGPGFLIGFDFTFDGVVYSRVGVHTNGWMTLGTTSVYVGSGFRPLSATTPVSPPELMARVAGLACDLQGQTGSTLRIETVGTAPNRECVIQWKGYSIYKMNNENINFQVRLVETTNQVKIVYGVMTRDYLLNSPVNVQVGLRDKPPTVAVNYANRILNPDWANTAAGITATDYCVFSKFIYPANGLTFTWDPLSACSGTPSPGNTLSNFNLVCSGQNFTLTLQNLTPGYNVTYQWQKSPDGLDPWSPVSGAIYYMLTTNQTVATYYRCQVTCSGNTGISNPLFVNMNTVPYCGYCNPTYSGNWVYDNIILVNLWPLSQSQGLRLTAYDNYVFTQNAVPKVARGQSFTLNLTFNNDPLQFFGVWIDFDLDNALESTEFFSTGTNAGANGTVNFAVTVPSDAPLGVTRMRLRGGDNVALTADKACGASNSEFGNGQDYLINIVAPCTLNGYVYDFNGDPISGASVVVTDRGTAVSGTDGYYTLAVPSGQIQAKCSKSGYNNDELTLDIPSGATVSQDFTLTVAESAVTPGSITMILPLNEIGEDELEINNSGNGPLDWNATVNYNVNRSTTPEYCTPSVFLATNAGNMYISRVVFNTIDNSSTGNGYSDFSALSTPLVPGNTYTINVTEAVSSPDDIMRAWFDWGQDGLFDETPVVFTGTPPNMTASVTVPQNVMPGSTRMRIRLLPGAVPVPCGQTLYGEVEDYTVNIQTWLGLDDYSGNVPAGEVATILVQVDPSKAEDGNPGIPGQTYISELVFNFTPEGESVTVPVTLNITDPGLDAPENMEILVFNADQGKIIVKWSLGTRNLEVDHYVIYRNGEYLGTSPTEHYIDILTEAGIYCYIVYAVYENGAYSEPSAEACIVWPQGPAVPVANWAILLGALAIGLYAFFMIRKRI